MSPSALRISRLSNRPLSLTRSQLSRRPSIASQSTRSASTTIAAVESETWSTATRLRRILWGTSISLFAAFGYLYLTDTRASVHQWLLVPTLRWIYPDAEDAHHAGTQWLKTLYALGLHPRERTSKSQKTREVDLSTIVFGQEMDNPIGTSAGIDKLADIPDALLALGPAIVEVGGATPYPQDGNPKPRVFRLPSQKALINRYGLNSLGAEDMAMRLRERVRLFAYHKGLGIGPEAEDLVLNGEAGVPPGSLVEGKLLAVQVAKNKFTKDEDIEAVRRDYVYCVEKLAPYADILVVNVSSPNTPGLRTLQRVEPLTRILESVVHAAKSVNRRTAPKVMVKVSPDEDQDEQIEGIVEAIWKSGVDGVIVGNTTKRRHNLIQEGAHISGTDRRILEEQGGFSGPHTFQHTLRLVKRYRQLLDRGPTTSFQTSPEHGETADAKDRASHQGPGGAVKSTPGPSKVDSVLPDRADPHVSGAYDRKVIFASGGITNGRQALEVLNAGASIAQIYTALVFGGSGTVTKIKHEMRQEIAQR